MSAPSIEWEKDDLDALRLLKVDVLGLGMLSCMRRGFDLLRIHYERTRRSGRCCEENTTSSNRDARAASTSRSTE